MNILFSMTIISTTALTRTRRARTPSHLREEPPPSVSLRSAGGAGRRHRPLPAAGYQVVAVNVGRHKQFQLQITHEFVSHHLSGAGRGRRPSGGERWTQNE